MKRIAVAVTMMLLFLAVAAAAQFTEWSAPVNVGPPVSSAANESCMEISKNGLSLYFARYTESWDLYVSQRTSIDEPWGLPTLLPNINNPNNALTQETCPALSLDEHQLYFSSNRDGGCGAADLYVSRRRDRRDDLGWEPPVNLGCDSHGYVNTTLNEQVPEFFEDETGAVVMYYGGPGFIRASRMRHDGTFGPGTVVTELGMAGASAVRRDGLEIIFASSRPGGLGCSDMWTATRESTEDLWSTPVNLGTVVNSNMADNGRLGLSFDGRALYFVSNRDGGTKCTDPGDVYVTTRERLHGKKQ